MFTMTLRQYLKGLTPPQMYCLVEWEEESSCSVVPLKAVLGGNIPTKGERRQVQWSKAAYWAKCVGTGSKTEMEELLDECMKEDVPQTEDSPPQKKKTKTSKINQAKTKTSKNNKKKAKTSKKKEKTSNTKAKKSGINIICVGGATECAAPTISSPSSTLTTPVTHSSPSTTPQSTLSSTSTTSTHTITHTSPSTTSQSSTPTTSTHTITHTSPSTTSQSSTPTTSTHTITHSTSLSTLSSIPTTTHTITLSSIPTTTHTITHSTSLSTLSSTPTTSTHTIPHSSASTASLSSSITLSAPTTSSVSLSSSFSTSIPSTVTLSPMHSPTINTNPWSRTPSPLPPPIPYTYTSQQLLMHVLDNQEKILNCLDYIMHNQFPFPYQYPAERQPYHPPQADTDYTCTGRQQHNINLITPEEVLAKYPKLRGDSKMGALAVALARECFFGEGVMKRSSVGGRGHATTPLPSEGMNAIRKVVLSLCTDYHNDIQKFEECVWSKCKTAINHACNKYRQ